MTPARLKLAEQPASAEAMAHEDGAEFTGLPIPEPVPDTAAYLRERELCLAMSPKKRENYDRYMRSSRRDAVVDYSPIRLDIENVSRCNFRCTMCHVSDWPKSKRAADMTFADFKKLVDSQDGLVELKIQGLGEPTMGGDTYFEMIRYARAQHIWVRTTTNASRLHLKDCYKKLVDSGVNEIQISIDGATKEVFEGIRRGSVFERVVANCKLINRYCDEKGIIRTKMWTTVQKTNVHQLPDLVELAHEMGFKRMAFSFDLVDFGIKKWRSTNDNAAVTAIDVELCRKMLARARSLGITLAFWNVTSRYDTDEPKHMCSWPFERAYISSDMRIVPCCIIGNPETSDVGDARKFASEWNGKALVEFRQAHLEGRVPAVCKSCYKARE
ncbi:MAG: radical SAM protein [Alphaproteobacteria bacterium]|nr:radical SAM protein [Alphaproteobacteria bacterium]